MFKVIGDANLTWIELSEVILDNKTQINRRPLSYVEYDVELPTLTPESFVHQRTNLLPEQDTCKTVKKIGEIGLRKRAKFLKTCKEGLWR